MLSLHLEKSRAILDGRLRFVRARLLGQKVPRATWLARAQEDKQLLLTKASALARKYAPAPTPAQQASKKAFSFPEVIRKEETPVSFKPAVAPPQVKVVQKGSKVRQSVFLACMALSFILLAVLFGPILYFRFFTHEVVPVQTQETGTPLGGEFTAPNPEVEVQKPPRDENLPEGNWLIIPRIGVNTEILESKVPEESLIKGVWRVPEFGDPGDPTEPMILAAHRYGYNWWWKGEYWKYHSFYLLPDLEPGDLVEVISDKRKYLYEIYAGEEGTEITDYDADLILYTCKFLTSDIRHFRYARLIDPSKYVNYATAAAEQSPATESAQVIQ